MNRGAKQDIFICAARRTPVAKPQRGLSRFTVAELTAAVVQDGLRQAPIPPDQVQGLVVGCAVGAGAGQNFPRAAALSAGLPSGIPAFSVGNVCASGTQALLVAGQFLHSGTADCVIAAGVESSSRSPQLLPRGQETPVSSQEHDGLRCSITGRLMGELCEDLAAREGISRAAQDAYALGSHQKAVLAQDQGRFAAELVPVAGGGPAECVRDEFPRRQMSLERLGLLPPAFAAEGSITAGNTASPGDGAACVVLASGRAVEAWGLTPLVRVLASGGFYTDPADVFAAGPGAIQACCQNAGVDLREIDLFDICEAFAAQAIFVRERLAIPEQRLNIYGGDISLGHPLGAAGLRGLVTLIHALRARRARRGLACASFGGGGALAVLVENVDGGL